MEVKEAQTSSSFACCICAKTELMSSHRIIDNFVKFDGSYVPLAEIIVQTLGFEVNIHAFLRLPATQPDFFLLAVT
jgi:hypothetical protein